MAFYDTTPAGRILSRVGKDTETMDVSTPELLNSLFNISSNLLAAFIIQAVGAWFMPIVYVVIFAIFIFFFSGYLTANHDVRYLDSVMRSPVMAIMNETLDVLKKAWTGEPFEYQGRTVRVTPKPARAAGPKIDMGGSTDKSAIRAGKAGYQYYPGHPALFEIYKEERAKAGFPAPEPLLKSAARRCICRYHS